MLKQKGLSKDRRLKSRKAIEQIFREGKSISAFPFKVLYLFRESTPDIPVLFGVTASSRNFKKATDRNRIKRLTREAYRIRQPDIFERCRATNTSLSLFFIYTGKEIVDFKTVEKAMEQCLLKLNRVVDENHTSNT